MRALSLAFTIAIFAATPSFAEPGHSRAVVNSPLERPALLARVKRNSAEGVRESLLADLRGDNDIRFDPALARLRDAFPDTYDGLTGLDLKKRLAFEDAEWREKQRAANQSNDRNGPSSETRLSRGIDDCVTLVACLQNLDENIHEPAWSSRGAALVAARLQEFGETAKQILLERLSDPDGNWRSASADLLRHWTIFSTDDLQPLLDGYRMQGGDSAAYPLARLGSDEAISALIRRVAVRGGQGGDTSKALADLGPKALPNLLPLLADAARSETASAVIGKMRARLAEPAADWARIALDPKQQRVTRIAALRGLTAMKNHARGVGDSLVALTRNYDGELRQAAQNALKAMSYPLAIYQEVSACKPSRDEFSSSRGSNGGCLGEIAAHGSAAAPFGQQIADKFLRAPNGADRADAATTLGYIAYDDAAPRLTTLLNDPDWRVVYAATRALGWLGAKEATSNIASVANTHWLPEVRDEARTVAAVLRSSNPRLPKRNFAMGSSDDDIFAPNPTIQNSTLACASRIWSWNGMEFSRPSRDTTAVTIAPTETRSAGKILASYRAPADRGQLLWRATSGAGGVLRAVPVRAVAKSSEGVIALFGEKAAFEYSAAANSQARYFGGGLSGHAYAVHVTTGADGTWKLSEVARLPLGADALAKIAPDVYAAWSSGRVVVFSPQAILGLASCTTTQN